MPALADAAGLIRDNGRQPGNLSVRESSRRWHADCFLPGMIMTTSTTRHHPSATPVASLLRALLFGTLLAATCAVAGTDGTQIRAAAEQAVRRLAPADSELLLRTSALDPRLQLTDCAQALQGFVAGDGELHDTTTVGVRCESPQRWTIYLQVALSIERPVLVSRRALPRDSAPQAADFEIQRRTLPGIGSRYIGDSAQLAGRTLRRALNSGEALSADALSIMPVIRRGQQITLLARAGDAEIRVAAIALTDGRPAEHISARNLSSNRVIEGVVRADGTVEVPL
jgi:flagella basal body P-ring formation protein FlgA